MAARYWVGGTATWDTTAGTKWATTSGGAGGAAIPTSADDVFLDATSGTVTITTGTTNPSIKSLNCTGFTGTLTGVQSFTVAGSVLFSATMTLGITGNLAINTTATLTSNGKTWLGSITFAGTSQTTTLADDWTVVGSVTLQGATSGIMNGFTMYCQTNLYSNSSSTTGTTNFVMTGTGQLGAQFTSRILNNNLTINTSGIITLTTAANLQFGTGTFTYIAGTVVTTSSTFGIAASCTLNLAGIVFNNIVFTASTTQTITLSSTLTATGTLTNTTINVTWTGTAGWIIGSLSLTTGDVVLNSGLTYIINNSFIVTGTAASPSLWTSSSSPTKAILTLSSGATCDIGYASFTDVDNSQGRTIWTYKGTVSNCNNINVLPIQYTTLTN